MQVETVGAGADGCRVRGLVKRVGVAVLCAGAVGAPSLAAAAPAPHGQAPVAAYQVRLASGVVPEAFRGDPEGLGRALRRDARVTQARFGRLVRGRGVRVVRGFWLVNVVSVRATPEGARWLRRAPGVVAVSPVVSRRVPARDLAAPRARAGARPALVPVRSSFEADATFPNITLVGAPVLWAQGSRGAGVRVGVLDMGLDPGHPVFGCTTGQVWSQASKCGRVIGYGDFTKTQPLTREPGTNIYPGRSHGTSVTSVLAGGVAGTPARTWGVAPQARILFARIADDNGSIDSDAEMAAAQWLIDPDGNPATRDEPGVVNGSFGGYSSVVPQLLVRVFRAAGIVPVFGAGNGGPVAGTVLTPSWAPEALSVGNTDNSDVIRPDSARGCLPGQAGVDPDRCTWTRRTDLGPPPSSIIKKPDLTAPGYSIAVACDRAYTVNCQSDYGGGFAAGIATPASSGTSLSSPTVAGVAVLLRERHPGWSAGQVMNALRASALDLGPTGWDPDYGYGRVRAVEADAYTPITTTPTIQKLNGLGEGEWLNGEVIGRYQLPVGFDLGDVVVSGDLVPWRQGTDLGHQKIRSWDPLTGVLVMAYQVDGDTAGPKTFTLTVSDTSDNTASIVHHVRRDLDDPVITVASRYEQVTGGVGAVITGRVTDGDSGPGWVLYRTCNQPSAATTRLSLAGDGSFRLPVSADVRTSVCFDLIPYDQAGKAGPWVTVAVEDITPIGTSPAPTPRPSPTPAVSPSPSPAPVPGPSAPGPVNAPALPAPAPQVPGAVFTTPASVTARGGAWRLPLRVTKAGRVTVTAGTWRATFTVRPGARALLVRPPARVLRSTRTLRLTGAGKAQVIRTR